ncbi:hypothetical protein OsJ_05310 [Oryza sativa Japonica Group]|uniref:Uncharacterized protein n=1 Tax=Oryza sativa subsp. japonica TaxID=39947 RepID=A3A2Z0_ORYSJ|nr:hypothetical protein OsJ_05310 [Oryza sativa Japonica Group]
MVLRWLTTALPLAAAAARHAAAAPSSAATLAAAAARHAAAASSSSAARQAAAAPSSAAKLAKARGFPLPPPRATLAAAAGPSSAAVAFLPEAERRVSAASLLEELNAFPEMSLVWSGGSAPLAARERRSSPKLRGAATTSPPPPPPTRTFQVKRPDDSSIRGGAQVIGAGDFFGWESNDCGCLADLAPFPHRGAPFPRRRCGAASPSLPWWFAAEQVRFGVGDPFESDDGGILPDLAAFLRRRRRCAHSRRIFEFESTHHGFGKSNNGMSGGFRFMLDDTDKRFRHVRARRNRWQQLVIRKMFSSSGKRSSSTSRQQTPSPTSLPAAIPSQPAAAISSSSSETNSSSEQEKGASSSACYIDESFGNQEIIDAETYVKANPMLVKANVLGSAKTFWRMSDIAVRLIRRLARILKILHEQKRYLLAPLSVQNLVIVSGELKLRNVTLADDDFSFDRIKCDYQYMSVVLEELIMLSVGQNGLSNIPPDFGKYLGLLKGLVKPDDEFLITNHASLLPMANRTDAFMMMYNHIMGYLGRKDPKKKIYILSHLKYDTDWLRTASGNSEIGKWLWRRRYGQTVKEFLHLNRNIRSHPYEHSEEKIEEALYGEWPELLVEMQEKLHKEGELQNTEMESKFGQQ